MSNLKQQAELAAARVDAESVGIDPFTIITILTQVLPLIVSCWNRNDEPNAEMSATNFVRYYEGHPEQALRRTARRIRAEADAPMSKEQSFALARAVIDQALEASPAEVKACCMEAKSAS